MLRRTNDWFRQTPEDTLRFFEASPNGLNSDDANRRLIEYGPNELEEAGRVSPLTLFLQQFANPMVVILLFAILVSIATVMVHGNHEAEGFIDAIVISAIVIFNAVFGFVQEYRSERALEALKDLSAPLAVAKRDGQWSEIETRNLVLGDIISLQAGDIVPADGRLLTVVGLSIDEAALTGESVPANKSVNPITDERLALGDKLNLVFQGSIVSTGKGTAVVTSTGMSTEYGKIAQLVQESGQELTPLQLDLKNLGKSLGAIVLVISIIVFAALIFVNGAYDLNEALFIAIALAVAAIPEGLPSIVTVTLAIGVSRMAKRNAIVRRLSSVETLGSTTIICSDKTGTITKNEMTVRNFWLPSSWVSVSGTGYDREGQFYTAQTPTDSGSLPKIEGEFDPTRSNELMMMLKVGQLCTNTSLTIDANTNTTWRVIGDPTEGALLVAAEKAGIGFENTRSEYEEVTEFSFDSKRKMMTTIYSDTQDQVWAFSKGSLEMILEKASTILVGEDERELDQETIDEILEANSNMSNGALRVLALAYRRLVPTSGEWNKDDVESDLVFLGLVGMIDPPREGVAEAIDRCRKAGIRPIMITGDHSLTAAAIARSIGLTRLESRVITGVELSDLSDDELEETVQEHDVYARVAPEHKLRIVQALKRQNHVVAMTGDGVNDAPAIVAADIGIAMGIRGAGVTKESSDLILTDDDFSTIVSAIETGREVYANIQKFVRFLLSANAGEVLLVFIMAIIGLPIPLTPVMILWINLVTDGPPALALGLDPPPKGILEQRPREPNTRLLDKATTRTILIGGVLATFAGGFIYLFFLSTNIGHIPGITGPTVDWSMVEYAQALQLSQTATFVTMVLFQLLWVWNCRDMRNPVWRTNMRESRGLFVAVAFSFLLTLMVMYTPLSFAFGVIPLSLDIWVLITISSLIGLLAPVYLLIGNGPSNISPDERHNSGY
ncbi:MAG: cation-translocating P-type ATPase [Candidatus Thorarchaeota archaeon]